MSGTVAAVVPMSVFNAYQKWVLTHQGAKAEAATNFYHYNTTGLTVGDVYSFGVSPAVELEYQNFLHATKGYVAPKTPKTPATKNHGKTTPAKVIPGGVTIHSGNATAAAKEAAYVKKHCPAASYGNNPKWLALVDHDCQPVVTKKSYWSASEGKTINVYTINTSANSVLVVNPKAGTKTVLDGGHINGTMCVGFTNAQCAALNPKSLILLI